MFHGSQSGTQPQREASDFFHRKMAVGQKTFTHSCLKPKDLKEEKSGNFISGSSLNLDKIRAFGWGISHICLLEASSIVSWFSNISIFVSWKPLAGGCSSPTACISLLFSLLLSYLSHHSFSPYVVQNSRDTTPYKDQEELRRGRGDGTDTGVQLPEGAPQPGPILARRHWAHHSTSHHLSCFTWEMRLLIIEPNTPIQRTESCHGEGTWVK